MTEIVTRAPRAADEADWRRLWDGYNRFYRANVPADVTDALWRALLVPAGGIEGLVATRDGAVAGLAHVVFHASTWSTRQSCYLEDLFVAPAARGSGAARGLIDAVSALALQRGADRLYWHTQDYNGAARSLYDTVAQRTSSLSTGSIWRRRPARIDAP